MNGRRIGAALATLAALLCAAPAATAQDGQTVVVPLSEPGKPATLEVSTLMGSITIEAHSGDDVVITTRDADGPPEGAVRSDGMRRIPNTSVGLTAEEQRNTVTVALDWSNRAIEIDIKVPRRTSVHASAVNGGEIVVRGVEGEHELSNVNGGITATGVAGSVVAGTTNGEVEVTFTSITPGKAMSFTTFNGGVDVTFPPGLQADLRINAGRGDVLTDFDVTVEPQESRVERSGEGGRYRVRLERQVLAAVGGGGPEMHFETFNGSIAIRRGSRGTTSAASSPRPGRSVAPHASGSKGAAAFQPPNACESSVT